MLELKQVLLKQQQPINQSFNRTMLELKLSSILAISSYACCFNRTMLELKHLIDEIKALAAYALIVPCWN